MDHFVFSTSLVISFLSPILFTSYHTRGFAWMPSLSLLQRLLTFVKLFSEFLTFPKGALATNITIDVVCGIMQNGSLGDEITRYAEVNKVLLEAYGQKCLDFSYSNLVSTLSEESWNSSGASGSRQWTYQTCTEFGFFQTSDLKDQPFGHSFPVG